jgi:hypothetical protein
MFFSLREPGDVEAEIRMMRQAFEGSILVVEGDDDSRFWKSRTHRDRCDIVIAYGKPNILCSVPRLDRKTCGGVLGVVDRDFDAMDGASLPSPNIVATDHHDLETMLICSPALDKILIELGSARKIRDFEQRAGHSVREALLERALPLGRLRWLSSRERLGLQFRKRGKDGLRRIDHGKFVKRSTWVMDPQAMVKVVLNFSSRHDLDSQELMDQMATLPSEHDPRQVCNGHDLIAILAIGLGGVLGSHKPSLDELERQLRLAHEWNHLEATALYREIRGWEARNPPYRVLENVRPAR